MFLFSIFREVSFTGSGRFYCTFLGFFGVKYVVFLVLCSYVGGIVCFSVFFVCFCFVKKYLLAKTEGSMGRSALLPSSFGKRYED